MQVEVSLSPLKRHRNHSLISSSYEHIQNILAPEIYPLPIRLDFDMGNLLEPDQFDESE